VRRARHQRDHRKPPSRVSGRSPPALRAPLLDRILSDVRRCVGFPGVSRWARCLGPFRPKTRARRPVRPKDNLGRNQVKPWELSQHLRHPPSSRAEGNPKRLSNWQRRSDRGVAPPSDPARRAWVSPMPAQGKAGADRAIRPLIVAAPAPPLCPAVQRKTMARAAEKPAPLVARPGACRQDEPGAALGLASPRPSGEARIRPCLS
jgi:hypothetical protein